jgi:hypothetical protein
MEQKHRGIRPGKRRNSWRRRGNARRQGRPTTAGPRATAPPRSRHAEATDGPQIAGHFTGSPLLFFFPFFFFCSSSFVFGRRRRRRDVFGRPQQRWRAEQSGAEEAGAPEQTQGAAPGQGPSRVAKGEGNDRGEGVPRVPPAARRPDRRAACLGRAGCTYVRTLAPSPVPPAAAAAARTSRRVARRRTRSSRRPIASGCHREYGRRAAPRPAAGRVSRAEDCPPRPAGCI